MPIQHRDYASEGQPTEPGSAFVDAWLLRACAKSLCGLRIRHCADLKGGNSEAVRIELSGADTSRDHCVLRDISAVHGLYSS